VYRQKTGSWLGEEGWLISQEKFSRPQALHSQQSHHRSRTLKLGSLEQGIFYSKAFVIHTTGAEADEVSAEGFHGG
jgi:hypothetical protein